MATAKTPFTPSRKRSTLGKLMPPRLGRVFVRERLFALLDEQAGVPGTWVAGPPGLGKTTLVATYLEARRLQTLWLQIDAQDADLAAFAHFLDLAVADAVPRRRTRMPVPTADDLRDATGFVRRCFRHLAAMLEAPWVLVLDNLQEAAPASPLYAGLAAVLTELPADARLIFISRELPPAAFARALAGQQLVVVDAHALRFTLAETRVLVDLHGHGIAADALQDSTDGWAAAMILIMAARGTGGVDKTRRTGASAVSGSASISTPDSAIDNEPVRGSLFAFFAGEVLAKMPPGDAATLARIAFLPSTTTAMAASLSGDSRAGLLLADLAARSLFTDRRSGTEPVFTLHALFGEFLRAHAAATLTAEALQALRLSAAALLAARGQADVAITQLLSAAAWRDAATLLNEHADRFVTQGRTASVLEWIFALPPAHREQPALRYWCGVCQLASNPSAALIELEHAQRGFAAADDATGSFQTAAAAADAIVFIGERLDVLEPWIARLSAHAPVYLAQRHAHADMALDLRVLPGLLAAYVNRRTADPLTARLADVAEGLLDQPLAASQRILLASLATYLMWTGQLARLDRIMVKIDRMCAVQDTAAATRLRWYGVGVLIRSLRGLAVEALADAQAALDVSAGQPAMMAKAHLLMVLAALSARDAERARKHLEEAAALIVPSSPIDTTTYGFQRGLLALLDGDWAAAQRVMDEALTSGRASGWPLREHIALLGVAMAATQNGRFDLAEAILQEARSHPFYAVCTWHHWIEALVAAHLADRQHDLPRCLAALRRAFAVSRAHGFDYGPLLYCCGDTMSRLCALAMAHGIDAPLALAIVRRHALPAPASALGSAGEQWPWPIRIRCLGHFAIECDGQALAQSRKESRKPLDLLKLTIALGGTAVRADRLAALLWPDMPGDAAQNSFDNAIHRLRKLVGERHIVVQSGALSLNPATCWTDVAALEACLREVDGLTAAAAPATVSGIAERALALYQGDFLAGDDSHPDVLVARNRLRAMFLRQLAALGARLEAQGQPEPAARVYRRVIEREPLAEDIVRHLIHCLLQRGLRAEAYEAYRNCRQQLSVVLGIRPSAETEALAGTLREG